MICRICKEDLVLDCFRLAKNGNKSGKDIFRRTECKVCAIKIRDSKKNAKASLNSWRKKWSGNKEAWAKRAREYRQQRKLSGNPIKRNCASDKYRKSGRFKFWIRTEVFRLKGFKCFYCSKKADQIDHVVPLISGGTDEINNLVPCCRSCNSSKQGKSLEEWFKYKQDQEDNALGHEIR